MLMPGLTIMTNRTINGEIAVIAINWCAENRVLVVFFWNNLIILLFSFLLFNCKISSTHRRWGKAKRVCVCASSITQLRLGVLVLSAHWFDQLIGLGDNFRSDSTNSLFYIIMDWIFGGVSIECNRNFKPFLCPPFIIMMVVRKGTLLVQSSFSQTPITGTEEF